MEMERHAAVLLPGVIRGFYMRRCSHPDLIEGKTRLLMDKNFAYASVLHRIRRVRALAAASRVCF